MLRYTCMHWWLSERGYKTFIFFGGCVCIAVFLGQRPLGISGSGWSSQTEERRLAAVQVPERIWHQPSYPDHRHTAAELPERAVVSPALHHASQVSALAWHAAIAWSCFAVYWKGVISCFGLIWFDFFSNTATVLHCGRFFSTWLCCAQN